MTHLLAIANSTTGTKGPAPTIKQQLLPPIAHEECRGIYLSLLDVEEGEDVVHGI